MRRMGWLLVVVLIGCQKPKEPEATTETPPPSAKAPEKALPQQAPSATGELGPASAGGLTWDDPPPLVRRKPKGSMRSAEYGVQGDPLAELTVFYFGPDQGGSVEANVTRWFSQFTQPDGSDTASKAKRSQRQVGGMEVTVVEAKGRFSGGMAMPGAPAPAEQPDAMLLGAIARGPRGAVFFKLVGPSAAVEAARPGFDALIGSLRPAP